MKRVCPECQTVYDDMRWTILCPHEPRQSMCAICHERGGQLSACKWPTKTFVRRYVMDLKIGDEVQLSEDRPLTAAVQELVDHTFDHRRKVVLSLGPSRVKIYTCPIYWTIRVKRNTCCGVLCCERCRCDRGEGAVYCADHWKAWEQVA